MFREDVGGMGGTLILSVTSSCDNTLVHTCVAIVGHVYSDSTLATLMKRDPLPITV